MSDKPEISAGVYPRGPMIHQLRNQGIKEKVIIHFAGDVMALKKTLI